MAAPAAPWPPAPGLHAALDVLCDVISGLRSPLRAQHRVLLADLLLPLYRTPGTLPHEHPPRAALSVFAAPLSRAVCLLVARSPAWAPLAVEGIIAGWPTAAQASAAKCELLLCALESVVGAADAHGGDALRACLPALSIALREEHAGVAARAAAMCAAPAVVAAVKARPAPAMTALLPPLIGDAAMHWSGEVNRARHAALTALKVRAANGNGTLCCELQIH